MVRVKDMWMPERSNEGYKVRDINVSGLMYGHWGPQRTEETQKLWHSLRPRQVALLSARHTAVDRPRRDRTFRCTPESLQVVEHVLPGPVLPSISAPMFARSAYVWLGCSQRFSRHAPSKWRRSPFRRDRSREKEKRDENDRWANASQKDS